LPPPTAEYAPEEIYKMPPEILLALVIGGITGIPAILHLTGRSGQKVLGDVKVPAPPSTDTTLRIRSTI